MEQTIAVKITTDAAGANETVKGYKAQLREATAELVNMSMKFGETSKEAANAAKKVAGLKDSIGDAKALADTFNPDKKFVALGGALQGAVGGFSAMQGAMGLFGSESKQVEQALLKVQSAMALQQGISGIAGAADSFKLLGAQGIKAFQGISKAIIATGIGALVVALGLIVAYWDDIIGLVGGVSSEQTKLNVKAQKDLDIQKQKQDALGSQDNILKQQGKSEKDILKIKIGQTAETIKAAEIQVQNQIVTNKAQTAAAQRNKDILQGLIRLVTAPLSILLKGIDLAGKALGQNFNLEQSFSGGLAKMIFDPEATAKKGEDTLIEQQKYLAKLKNDKAGMEISIKGIDEKASADKAKGNDKKIKEEQDAAKKKKEFDDNLAKEKAITDELVKQAAIDNIKDELKRKEAEIDFAAKKETDKNKTLLDQKLINKADFDTREKIASDAVTAQKQIAKDAADKAAAAIELTNTKALNDAKLLEAERVNAVLGTDSPEVAIEKITNLEAAKLEAENASFELAKANKNLTNGEIELLEQQHEDKLKTIAADSSAAKLNIQEKETAGKLALIKSYLQAANDISNLLGQETVAAKAIGVANALINTYEGIAAGVKLGFPAAIPAVISAAATGFGAVKNILATKIPGKGSGSASLPAGANVATAVASASAPLAAQAATTTLDQKSINSIGQASSRAFVLETDVTNNQERIARLNRAARIN